MENIKERIKKKGISKYKLAKLLGVSWQSVHAWCNGWYKPTPDKVAKIKEILACK